MKINECSVIDNKVIDEMIDILFEQVANENNNITRKSIQSNLAILYGIKNTLKPLEPIVRDAYNSGVDNTSYDSFEDCYDVTVTAEDYIDQTDI